MRMNFGCGSVQPDGWVNIDKLDSGAYSDIRTWNGQWSERYDYIVANHSISDLDFHELDPALKELRRCLRPGGVLRVLVPDLMGAVKAYQRRDYEWFPQGNDLTSIDERFCTFVGWFGTAKSNFTEGYLRLLLERAGFRTVIRSNVRGRTLSSDREIVSLDDRQPTALVMEGQK